MRISDWSSDVCSSDLAVEVQVLRVDVGDHGDGRRQLHEAAVRFVGLHHHPVAGAEPGVGADGVDDAAVDDRRVEAGCIQHRRHQRGGSGLAVRSEEHTSELQSLMRISYAVFCLQKKNHLLTIYYE